MRYGACDVAMAYVRVRLRYGAVVDACTSADRIPEIDAVAGASRGWGPWPGRDFDLPRHSHYSGVIPMVFEHSAAVSAAEPREHRGCGTVPEYSMDRSW